MRMRLIPGLIPTMRILISLMRNRSAMRNLRLMRNQIAMRDLRLVSYLRLRRNPSMSFMLP